jgi:hypothetical protein
MSFLGRIGKFAKTPQGKRFIREAQDLSRDPRTKQRISEARDRLTKRDRPPQNPRAKA